MYFRHDRKMHRCRTWVIATTVRLWCGISMAMGDTDQRFRVTFGIYPPTKGMRRAYTVITFYGEFKAIAWATHVHYLDHPDERIFSVDVEELDRGTQEERDKDLTDRMEW